MIQTIRIENFKSIREVVVDLDPITVFVGKSGTGKSNFVNAIRFLRDYLDSGQNVREVQKTYGPVTALMPATGSSEGPCFDVDFRIPGYPDAFRYYLALHKNGYQTPWKEEFKYGGRTIFCQTGFTPGNATWETKPPLVTVPQPGLPALGRLPAIPEAVVAFTALTVGIGVHNFGTRVLTPKQPTNHRSGLADDASNYLAVMKQIASDLQNVYTRKSIVATLARINPTVVTVELDSIQQPNNVLVGHRLFDKTLEVNLADESDGFRRFYAHLLALYQTPPKQTLIVEEPENGIYPGALALLADEFKAAPDAGRGQVILTTHSPRLLDHFEADQIRVVELVDLETKIGRLAAEQRTALDEKLLEPGELLTVDEARLEGVSA